MEKTTAFALVLAACSFAGCGSEEPPREQGCVLTFDPQQLEEEPLEPVEAVMEEQEPEQEAVLRDADAGDPNFLSDSPFESEVFSSVIGVGGGAGGKYGGRFGGRRGAARTGVEQPSSESYAPVNESGFRLAELEPISTVSIDVDTASYTNVRRHLLEGALPPRDAVRIEELLNYFRYDDAPPTGAEPFAVTSEVASCPWEPGHRLVRIGLRARTLALEELPPANLVFLVDVSGSMDSPDKLPLVVDGLRMLVRNLGPRDRVALAVYAGAAGLVLPSTSCANPGPILAALERLEAGGSTAGAEGIQLAYQVARENFLAGGTNRVVLATDGDFNVGISDRGALEALIQEQAQSGVFLSVLGVGTGNLKDDRLETLADRGNGNYAYLDSLAEAKRALVTELGGTLVTLAKDVKLQAEFNPLEVLAWRLIGYENRVLAATDFRNDAKDAGELGAGHSLTFLYEIVPSGAPSPLGEVGALRYRTPDSPSPAAHAGELLTLALRWKAPEAEHAAESRVIVRDGGTDLHAASEDLRFAAAVATFGLTLRASEHRGSASFALAGSLARASLGSDANGTRGEFLELVTRAEALSTSVARVDEHSTRAAGR